MTTLPRLSNVDTATLAVQTYDTHGTLQAQTSTANAMRTEYVNFSLRQLYREFDDYVKHTVVVSRSDELTETERQNPQTQEPA